MRDLNYHTDQDIVDDFAYMLRMGGHRALLAWIKDLYIAAVRQSKEK